MSYPLVKRLQRRPLTSFLLDRSCGSNFKGLQDIPEALLALPLYYFFFGCVPSHEHVYAHMHTTLLTDISVLACHCVMVTIQSAPRANTLSSWVTKKKEQNALKLYKAQCGFCCYSETRPSLSPTHSAKSLTDV